MNQGSSLTNPVALRSSEALSLQGEELSQICGHWGTVDLGT